MTFFVKKEKRIKVLCGEGGGGGLKQKAFFENLYKKTKLMSFPLSMLFTHLLNPVSFLLYLFYLLFYPNSFYKNKKKTKIIQVFGFF